MSKDAFLALTDELTFSSEDIYKFNKTHISRLKFYTCLPPVSKMTSHNLKQLKSVVRVKDFVL